MLLIYLSKSQTIAFGRRREAYFRRGYYAYVGSAMNGLEARVNRHLRKDKKRHWHIDYLLEKATVTRVILAESERRNECAVAESLQGRFDSVPGFGCSDCQCRSHLFLATNKRRLESTIMTALRAPEIRPWLRTGGVSP